MGRLMKEDDIYISGLLDLLNLRFGPSQGPGEAFGGIDELAVLQKEFQLFQKGRSLRNCFALLNLGGFWNARAKNRWLSLIDDLSSYESDTAKENGHDRIMNTIIENLTSSRPTPMFFKAHDSRGDDGRRVIVRKSSTGPFYVEQEHIVVSLPMRPRSDAAEVKPAGRSSKK